MWTVELPAAFPLINANARLHWTKRSQQTRNIRTAATVCARAVSVPHLARAHVIAEYRPPDRRKRDVHNLFPSAKAAVDGLVDAGVLADDSDTYLIGPDMRLGQPEKGGRLVLHIHEMEVTP